MPEKLISMHEFQPAAVVRVTGDDAFDFLQGQFTNDLRFPTDSVTYGLWLNQKGKVLADSKILRLADQEFLVTSHYSTAAVIIQRLEQYIIADDVTLDDQTSTTDALCFWGEKSGEMARDVFGEIPAAGSFSKPKSGLLLFDLRGGVTGFELLGSATAIRGAKTALLGCGGVEVAGQDAERSRIEAGIVSIPHDIGPTDLPQEAGLETTAISFNKGCYLGQEVMARLKNLGQVRRQLKPIRGPGPAPVHGAPLFQGTKKVGEIRSAVVTTDGFLAFAMLSRMGLDENAGFSLEAAGEINPTVSLWTK